MPRARPRRRRCAPRSGCGDSSADLLLLARADAGRATLRAPTDVGTVLTEAAAELEPVAGGHELSVDVEPAFVEGARDELHRLAVNLMENAIRHTPDGTQVRASVAQANGEVVITVEDDGPGVPDELAPRIFERFVRGGGDHAGSAGLGLAIVRAVAEGHGGNVALERSANGAGARFVVRLPAARTHSQRLPPLELALSSPPMLAPMQKRPRSAVPDHIAIVAGIGAVLVLAGVGIGAAVSDSGGGGERVRAPFDRDPARPGRSRLPARRPRRPRRARRPGGPGFHGSGPGGPGFRKGGPGFDQNVTQVLRDINQAVATDASKLAGPILDKAVKDKKITKAQADAIRQRLTAKAAGGGPGPRGGGF